jgi:hypothetical protein
MAVLINPFPSTKFTLSYRDGEGRDRTTTFHAQYSKALGDSDSAGDASATTILQAMATAITALTNAGYIKGTISQEYGFGTALGTVAQYPSNRQKAMLHFADGTSGDQLVIEIMAPKASIFVSNDDETVLASAITTLTAALNSNSITTRDGTPGGSPGTWAYIRGYLLEKKPSRKLSPGFSSELGGE